MVRLKNRLTNRSKNQPRGLEAAEAWNQERRLHLVQLYLFILFLHCKFLLPSLQNGPAMFFLPIINHFDSLKFKFLSVTFFIEVKHTFSKDGPIVCEVLSDLPLRAEKSWEEARDVDTFCWPLSKRHKRDSCLFFCIDFDEERSENV